MNDLELNPLADALAAAQVAMDQGITAILVLGGIGLGAAVVHSIFKAYIDNRHSVWK